MMSFEVFSATILKKTTKRREQRELKKVTKPQLKGAYKMIQEDSEKFSKMSDDKIISYFTGWFLL